MASVSMKRWGIAADHISMGELYLGMIFIEFKRNEFTRNQQKDLNLSGPGSQARPVIG